MEIAIIGCGYDGSCLPADTLMLTKSVPDQDNSVLLIEAMVAFSDQWKHAIGDNLQIIYRAEGPL